MFDIETYSSLQRQEDYKLLENESMAHDDMIDGDFQQIKPDPKDQIVSLTDDIIYLSVRKCCKSVDHFHFIRYVMRTLFDIMSIFGFIAFIISVS